MEIFDILVKEVVEEVFGLIMRKVFNFVVIVFFQYVFGIWIMDFFQVNSVDVDILGELLMLEYRLVFFS